MESRELKLLQVRVSLTGITFHIQCVAKYLYTVDT